MKERNGKKVLVAEKDDAVRESLVDYLDSIGCQVTACSDSHSLLRAAPDTAYNVILLGDDLSLSGGPSLLAKLLNVNATTAVVVLVAYRSVDQILDAFRRGAVDVIIKPYQYHELVTTLGRAFERNRQNLIGSFFKEHRADIVRMAGGDKLEWEEHPLESRA